MNHHQSSIVFCVTHSFYAEPYCCRPYVSFLQSCPYTKICFVCCFWRLLTSVDLVILWIDCLVCLPNFPWCTNFTSLAIVFCVMCTIILVLSNLAHQMCVCQSMSSGFCQNTSFSLLWVLLQIDISLFCFFVRWWSIVVGGGLWWCSMVVIYGALWWSMVLCGDLWCSVVLYGGDLWCSLVVCGGAPVVTQCGGNCALVLSGSHNTLAYCCKHVAPHKVCYTITSRNNPWAEIVQRC